MIAPPEAVEGTARARRSRIADASHPESHEQRLPGRPVARRPRVVKPAPEYDDVEGYEAFAKRSRMGVSTLTLLVNEGAVTKVFRTAGCRRRYIVERGMERAEIWSRFVERHSRPRTFEEFASVVRVAEALRIPGHFEWPDSFVDAALDLLEEEGLPLKVIELHGLMRSEDKTLRRLFKAGVERRGGSIRRFHAHSRPEASVADFRTALSALDGVEDTMLAQPDEVLDRMIDARARGAVLAIRDPLVRNMAGLFVCLDAFKVTAHWMQQVVHHLTIAAEILEGVDKRDAVAVDRVLRNYVFASGSLWADGAPTRHSVGSSWLTASNLWKAHSQTFRSTRRQLKAAMPAFPHLVTHFAVDLRRNRRRIKAMAGRTRKVRTNVVADLRDQTEVALEARMSQLDRWTDEFVERRRALEAEPARDRICYSFAEDVVPETGIPAGARQVVYCEAVRVPALRAELFAAARGRHRQLVRSYMEGGKEHDPADADVIVCVFRGVRPAEGSDGPAVPPAFVRLHAAGCLMNPTRLTAAKQAERARLHRLWRLPPWTYSPQDLLVPFSGAADVIAGHALRMDVLVLQLEPFRHAARFGHLAGRLGLRNGVRSGETLQFRWQRGGFGFARVAGQVHIGFRAVPKGWSEQRLFLLDDRTFVAANDLVRLSIERLHGGAENMTLPKRDVGRLRRVCGADVHAVFQGRNAMLDARNLNQFYRLLMAGLPPSTMHDLRHVYATVAYDEGVALPDISDLLSQEIGHLAGYYAAADRRLRQVNEVGFSERRDNAVALS